MKNLHNLTEKATPVSNSNNEALVQAAQAVVNAVQDKKPEGDKAKGKKPKRATEMSHLACFYEVTRTANRIFLKNTPKEVCHLLKPEQLARLKDDAVYKALDKFKAKHGSGFDINDYFICFWRLTAVVAATEPFQEWLQKETKIKINDPFDAMIPAMHIVFKGAEFIQKVLVKDYVEHGELKIGWHRDYVCPLLLDQINQTLSKIFTETDESDNQSGNDANPEAPEAPKAPKGVAKKDADAKE